MVEHKKRGARIEFANIDTSFLEMAGTNVTSPTIRILLRRQKPLRSVGACSSGVRGNHAFPGGRHTSMMPAHFARFLSNRSSPGLIIVDQDLDIGRSIEELLLIWTATDIDEWKDKIGYVPI